MRLSDGLRALAVYEAAKGVLVLLAGFGLLALLHRDLQAIADQLVAHLHLNPARGYPRILLDVLGNVTSTRLRWLAGFALLYAAVRFIEGYGLWRERRWAQWFGLASGAIYVPAELYEVIQGATWLKVNLLTLNICIVAYLIFVLRRSKRQRLDPRESEPGHSA